MNIANLELCQTLYELSGWRDDINGFYDASEFTDTEFRQKLLQDNRNCPAYDLGYLIRKLPQWSFVNKNPVDYLARYEFAGAIIVDEETNQPVGTRQPGDYSFTADTPEDALAKLAIELWKQGILK